MSFWLIAGLMTAVALAVALLPLLRASSRDRDRHAENLEIYRRRLQELDSEVAEGQLPPEEADVARAELEKRLLQDMSGAPETAGAVGQVGGVGRTGRRAVFWVIFAALPLAAFGLYLVLGVPPQTGDAAGAAGNLPQLVAGLEQRLSEQPDNGDGWALLGRSYLALGQPDRAAKAFSKARALLGDDPRLLADYAGALAARAGGDFRGRPETLLQKALDRAPDNPRSLWLAGMAAAQRGDSDQARRYWQRLLRQLDPGSDDAATVKRRIARLQPGSPAAAATDATGATAPAASQSPGITVKVTLAPDIAAKAQPDDAVFVFARQADGPPMPLAAVRRRVADLPLTVRLDDDASMMPGRSLSQADRIVVGARVSQGGSAIPQSGDLQGMSKPVSLAQTDKVSIMIDSVVP